MTEALIASMPQGAVQAAAKLAQSMGKLKMDVGALHQLVLSQLDDDQAQEIVTIPLEGKSSIADHMVIASGRSTRQVASIAQKLAEVIKNVHIKLTADGLVIEDTGAPSLESIAEAVA